MATLTRVLDRDPAGWARQVMPCVRGIGAGACTGDEVHIAPCLRVDGYDITITHSHEQHEYYFWRVLGLGREALDAWVALYLPALRADAWHSGVPLPYTEDFEPLNPGEEWL